LSFPSTFQDVQNAVIKKARLNSTNDLSSVKDWINQVYAEACIDLSLNVTTTTAALTPGTAGYALSTLASSVKRIIEMYVTPVGGQQSKPLQATTLDYILTRRQSAGGTSATSGYVTHYALVGLDRIEFYPTPSTADTLTIWYVGLPTALSANGDVPILPEPYSTKILEFGTLAEAADFKGDPSEQEYRQLYELWKGKLRAHLTRRKGAQPGQFGFYPTRNYPAHDPSTDVGF
jgi:hypothetical protein